MANKSIRDKVNLQVKFIDKETLKKEINEKHLREVTKINNKYIV